LDARPDQGMNEVYIQEMRVEPPFKGQGISVLMFKKLFTTYGKDMTYHAELSYDNFNELMRVEAKMRNWRSAMYQPGLTYEQRLRKAADYTPFMKAWAKFGYTEIFHHNVVYTRSGSPTGPRVPSLFIKIRRPRVE